MSRTTRKKVETGWDTVCDYTGLTRDGKPWFKPDYKFKYTEKRIRKAKERQAFREGREVPIFKHSDEWNYI